MNRPPDEHVILSEIERKDLRTLKRWLDSLSDAINEREGEKFKITSEGGYAVKLTNRTGAASVKGTVITTDLTYDNSFKVQAAEFEACGVVYDNGVANGAECFVVIAGIAEVLLKNGTAATRGYWTKCADTDGRGEVTTPPSGLGAQATSEHFKEIGHCLENKTAGTNVLAKLIIHFN